MFPMNIEQLIYICLLHSNHQNQSLNLIYPPTGPPDIDVSQVYLVRGHGEVAAYLAEGVELKGHVAAQLNLNQARM